MRGGGGLTSVELLLELPLESQQELLEEELLLLEELLEELLPPLTSLRTDSRRPAWAACGHRHSIVTSSIHAAIPPFHPVITTPTCHCRLALGSGADPRKTRGSHPVVMRVTGGSPGVTVTAGATSRAARAVECERMTCAVEGSASTTAQDDALWLSRGPARDVGGQRQLREVSGVRVVPRAFDPARIPAT
jgi:hypothetical protein